MKPVLHGRTTTIEYENNPVQDDPFLIHIGKEDEQRPSHPLIPPSRL